MVGMGQAVLIHFSTGLVATGRIFRNLEGRFLCSGFLVQYKSELVEAHKDNTSVVWAPGCHPYSPKTTITPKCDGKAAGHQEEIICGPHCEAFPFS